MGGKRGPTNRHIARTAHFQWIRINASSPVCNGLSLKCRASASAYDIRRTQGRLPPRFPRAEAGLNMATALASRVIDLAVDYAHDAARRQLDKLTWRSFPRF